MTLAEQIRKVPASVRPTVRAARRAVKSAAPKAEEIAYDGGPPRSKSMLWKLARYAVDGDNVVGIGVFPSYTSLYFYRGRELDDPKGLLEGSGRTMRFTRLASPLDADKAAVKRLLRKAFRLAAET